MGDLRQGPTDGWDRVCVERLYGQELGARICDIPLVHNGPSDRIVWFHSPNGVYTIKSGYFWLILKNIGYGPHRFFWRLIWKMKVPPKIRVFAWKLGHDLLPTNLKIAAVNLNFNSSCPRCGLSEESLVHALRDCSFAKEVLRMGGVDNRVIEMVGLMALIGWSLP